MAKRTRAPARPSRATKNSRQPAREKPVRAGTPARLPHSRRYRYTPELLAEGRRRYEQTPDPLASIAADFGVHETTITRLARELGWVRCVAPPRDLSPAARLAAAARALAPQDDGESPGGNAAALPENKPPVVDSIARLHAAVLQELAAVESMRRQLNAEPQRPADAERTAHTLTQLTRAVHDLQRMQCGAPQTDNAHDDSPADIDEFRNDLARRIDAFVASHADQGGAQEPAASPADEA